MLIGVLRGDGACSRTIVQIAPWPQTPGEFVREGEHARGADSNSCRTRGCVVGMRERSMEFDSPGALVEPGVLGTQAVGS